MDPGTTQLTFRDHRLGDRIIYKAKRVPRESVPVARNIETTTPCFMISENSPERDSLFMSKLKSLKVPVEHLTFPDALHPSWHWDPWFTVTMERSHLQQYA